MRFSGLVCPILKDPWNPCFCWTATPSHSSIQSFTTGDRESRKNLDKSPTFERVTLSLQSLYVQQRCKNGDENRRQDRDQCQSATRILMHKDLRQHQGDDAAD